MYQLRIEAPSGIFVFKKSNRIFLTIEYHLRFFDLIDTSTRKPFEVTFHVNIEGEFILPY